MFDSFLLLDYKQVQFISKKTILEELKSSFFLPAYWILFSKASKKSIQKPRNQ